MFRMSMLLKAACFLAITVPGTLAIRANAQAVNVVGVVQTNDPSKLEIVDVHDYVFFRRGRPIHISCFSYLNTANLSDSILEPNPHILVLEPGYYKAASRDMFGERWGTYSLEVWQDDPTGSNGHFRLTFTADSGAVLFDREADFTPGPYTSVSINL